MRLFQTPPHRWSPPVVQLGKPSCAWVNLCARHAGGGAGSLVGLPKVEIWISGASAKTKDGRAGGRTPGLMDAHALVDRRLWKRAIVSLSVGTVYCGSEGREAQPSGRSGVVLPGNPSTQSPGEGEVGRVPNIVQAHCAWADRRAGGATGWAGV